MVELSRIDSTTETCGTSDQANTKEDKSNISVLLMLYIFGNFATSLAAGIQISNPSCLFWNFSDPHANCIMLVIQYKILSILWAPILDSLFGRRKWKSWLALVQIQYYIGIFLLIAGSLKNERLLNEYTELLHELNWRDYKLRHQPLPARLVLVFISVILSCLAATQDIVVNGWALTMLKRKNLCYTSTCSGIGQAVGFFCGYFLPIQLFLEKFKVDIFEDYLYFWGVTFVIVAIAMAQYVPEKDDSTEPKVVSLGAIESYKLLVKTLKLPNIKNLIMILLTVEISFRSAEVAFEKSDFNRIVPKSETFAIEFLSSCFRIFLPLIFLKIISSRTPFGNYLRLMKYRLLSCAVITVIVYVTSYYGVHAKQSIKFYSVIRVIFHEYNMYFIMWCTAVTFFAGISEPKIGGTCMTLLTLFTYLGYVASGILNSWFIDFLNYIQCPNIDRSMSSPCSNKNDTDVCRSFGEICQNYVDGFYVAPVVSTIYGFIWFYVLSKNVINLQLKNVKQWHVETK